MKKVILLIALFAFTMNLSAQKTKEDLFQSIMKRYGKVSSIELNFKMENNPLYEGSIKAKKGNRFIIKMHDMTVISNGTNTWNLNEKDKKVMVSNFEKSAKNKLSLDKLFFSLTNDYFPKDLSVLKKYPGKKYYKLNLEAKSKNSGAIPKLSVYLDKSGQNVVGLDYEERGSVWNVSISMMKINPKFDDKMFDYSPPKGMQLIDLR